MNIEQLLGRIVPDYNLVRRKVEEILKDNSIIDPPIIPKEIAENYGNIKVVFYEFPEKFSHVMGFCEFKKDTIIVNHDNPTNRQTFTIAHELGHLLLHKEAFTKDPSKYKILLREPLGRIKDPLEQEANTFAANLLVPKSFLDRYYKVASTEELSRLFMVSEDVIRYRIKDEYGTQS